MIEKKAIIEAVQNTLIEADKQRKGPKIAAIKALEALAAYKALTGLLDRKNDFELINDLYFLYLEKIEILTDRSRYILTDNELMDLAIED